MSSQNPPGSKPPAPSSPSPTEQPWISPRLREKLGEPEPGAPKEGTPPWVGILLVLLVVGGGAGLFVTMRSGAAKQKAEAERVAAARAEQNRADSLASAAKIDSMRAVVAARAAADSAAGRSKPSTGSAAAKPAAGGATASRTPSTPPASGGGAAPVTPKVVEKGPFGLDVGSFLAEDRATSELARLSAATGLKGRVVTRNEDGGDVYHIVLGSFPTRGAADRRAESLVGRSLVNQAQSVPLAP